MTHDLPPLGNPIAGVSQLGHKKKTAVCPRLDPEERLCPAFDSCSIKLFAAPDREEMGVAVVDNCAEEHMQ